MEKKVSVVLVGIAGYGNIYAREFFIDNNVNAYLTGVVDLYPENSRYYQDIMDHNIPVYSDLEDFYQEHSADLAIISTPIHLHKQQACLAMENGSHVLCEKPATANREHLQEMIDTRDRMNKLLAIGFNWSFTDSIQQLKEDILSGLYGRPIRMKGLVLWPRNADYYNRSSWAGKKLSSDGELILDSVANNATAHFLHHLLYLTGDSLEQSAEIDQLSAELYRANPIETFDTCAVHLLTKNNVEMVYLASHAVANEHRPEYTLEFEHATITYRPTIESSDIVAKFKDGKEKIYKDPEKDHLAKFGFIINTILAGSNTVLCGPEAASAHVNAIYGMHQSVKDVPHFPKKWITVNEEKKLRIVEGLEETLTQCYEQFCLPSDLGVEWSQSGSIVKL
ncbi:Gfo/Idh/MocA family oxidoreductase [Gracilibacillus oryzae]|uniref:Gfo/Idh/MocA family oxidoreductase n=1 Tax=Gracilibacillus oryzae TaxID=1672701 RepID=A0A7C8GS59_9BACI|nr:Gfo/Idh/MocA family oxidoreductase [Gracilibacillus oryzae]KAB8131042.1 Gfo/Idh/MocA family oxidoreductase [Gracilibacillus oryzae]